MQMRIRVSESFIEALKYKLIWIAYLFLALLVMLQQIVLHAVAFPSRPVPDSYFFSIFILKAGLVVVALSMLWDVYKEVRRSLEGGGEGGKEK